MVSLFTILTIEIIFCFITYIHINGVFVHPTLLSFLVIMVSTIFGIIGNVVWKVDVSYFTIVVIIIGFSAMFLGDVIAKKVTRQYKYKENHECREIVINKFKMQLVILGVIILTLLYCFDILRAGKLLGKSGLGAIYAVKRDRSGTSLLIRQGVKIVMATAFVHSFFFVNNYMILRIRTYENLMHLIPIICGAICCVFTSVRTDVLRIMTAIVVDYCILLFQEKKWKRKSVRKFIRKIFPIAVAVAILLTAVRFIVKGDSNATSNSYGIFQYIAYYVGTPIVVLGSKLTDGILQYRGNVWGEITFNQAWFFFQRIGLCLNVSLRSGSANVWIDESKAITANVDTIFGPPMIDFGIIGMAIYVFLVYLILNKFFYRYLYKTQSGKKRDKKLIVYSYLATIASMSYYTNLLNQFLTVYLVVTFVLMVILYQFYDIHYQREK